MKKQIVFLIMLGSLVTSQMNASYLNAIVNHKQALLVTAGAATLVYGVCKTVISRLPVSVSDDMSQPATSVKKIKELNFYEKIRQKINPSLVASFGFFTLAAYFKWFRK